ncbi:hypothetical protein PV326_007317 [Microctonus aethiopoides]|nr:hypothetical protein PV326_007317 [Microctonus aethiopoides]
MLSILVAKVTNLIATDVQYTHAISERQKLSLINQKKYNIADSSDHLMWFLQISDIHISIFKDPSRISEFKEFCEITVNAINPPVVLASGDLTDAKTQDAMGSRQYLSEWKHYKEILDKTKIMNKTVWLDVRGNHDNFNILTIKSPENYFLNYSIQGQKHTRSYMHEISVGSEKFTFIAIDACLEPGPRRPFNFVGQLTEEEIKKLNHFAEKSRSHNNDFIIWFGHYPTSCILSQYEETVRDVIGKYNEGMVYLCGHYHTLGGISPQMYTLQRMGFLELELADWKDNRMYRLAAIDHGHFSFIDIKHGEWPVILITNPKHALYTMPLKENLQSVVKSTHIRILVFSTVPITSVDAQINDETWIKCVHIKGPLYVAKWDTSSYQTGIHYIRVKAIDLNNNQKMTTQPFALDGSRLSFGVLPRIILMSDATTIFGVFFGVILFVNVGILCIFRICHKLCEMKRMRRIHTGIRVINCSIRKLWILSTIDRMFYPLILYPIYLTFGPWAIGEVIENHIGIIFAWGMFIGKSYLPGSFTYAYGFFQLLTFHVPLIVLLAHRVDKRFQAIEKPPRRTPRYLQLFWRNLPFVLLISMQMIMIYFFWLAYGTLATVLCPLRTWSVVLALILWHQAHVMPDGCLRSAAFIWSASGQLSMTE